MTCAATTATPSTPIARRPARNLQQLSEELLRRDLTVTPRTLRRMGLPVGTIRQCFTYEFSECPADFQAVLALRAKAYSAADAVRRNRSPQSLEDRFDTRARILVVKHHGRVIGTARLMFPNGPSDSEHAQCVAIPDHLPDVSECVEITRACVDYAYRGTDVFLGIVRECVKAVYRSGRRYILAGSRWHLLDFYTRVGFMTTGVEYRNAAVGDPKHELLLMDVRAAVELRKVDRSVWTNLYSSIPTDAGT